MPYVKLQSSGTMSLSDVYQDINETGDTMPSGNTNVSLYTLSELMQNASIEGATSREDMGDESAPRAFSEFYGYHYPGNYYGVIDVLYLGHPTAYPLDENNDTLVEGEDLGVRFQNDQHSSGNQTKVYIVTEAGSAVTGTPTYQLFTRHGSPISEYRDAIDDVVLNVGSYEGATLKVKVVESILGLDSNIFSNTFTYRDSIVGHCSTGLSYYSTTVSVADESVATVTVAPTVSVGTQQGLTGTDIGVSNLSGAGDGGTMSTTIGSEVPAVCTIVNTPGKIRFTTTHEGAGLIIDPSRNSDTSYADLDIPYARIIESVGRDASTYNHGDTVTISAIGEGVSGTHTMRLAYGTTNDDTTYTGYVDKSTSTSLYLRQSKSHGMVLSLTGTTSLQTYYPKAWYTSGVNSMGLGSSFIVAPEFLYTKTNSTAINVSTTQAFSTSVSSGNGASIAITSSPDIGSGTDSATMTPLLKTGTFTVTFTGTANYQPANDNNQSSILSVDPTVSVVLTDNQAGDNIPITDAHSDTIASGTHGVSPTIFTHTPTVAGTLQNGNALTYLWTAASSYFTYTSGGTATAGAVSFNKNSSGTRTHTLLVTGDDDRDASAGSSVVCKIVTKTVSGASSDVLRIGTTFTVTSISTAYTQTVAIYRQAADDGYYKIANGVSVASTINFSMSGDAWIPDTTARTVRLVDDDNTGIVDSLGSFVILNPLPVIDTFTATQTTTLGAIYLVWTTTAATDISINQSVGSQVSMDGNTTDTGNSNDEEITYTLTAKNDDDEAVTAQATATTINPTLTIGDPSTDAWIWGDTGNVTIVATKNFANALTGHMGYSLNATPGGGTELQTLTNQGNGSTGDITLTFDKNDWDYAVSLGSAITDFRAGNAAASWVVSNNSATVSDFSTPNAATSYSAVGSSAVGIQISWTNPTGTFTGVKLYGGPVDLGYSLLTTILNGNTPTFAHAGLNDAQAYNYYLQTYYDRTADSTTRTKTVNTSTFQGNVIGWDSEVVYGTEMLSNNGTGWSDGVSGITSGQEDAYQQNSATSKTLYHLSSQTLGTDTVSLHRSEDGAVYNGNNSWFSTGETPDVFYMTTSGQVTAPLYILGANAKPDPPINGTATVNSATQITLGWSCTSGIEDSFKIFRSTSSYPSTSGTLITTTSANATSYVNTGLDPSTQYYYSIYSFNGTTYSSVRATATGTTTGATWTAVPANFSIEGGPFSTQTSGPKTATITGADTDVNATTVSCTDGVLVSLSLTYGSGYTSFASSKNFTIPNASDTLYAKFRYTFPKGQTPPLEFTSDVTYSNGGISNTDLEIDVQESVV